MYCLSTLKIMKWNRLAFYAIIPYASLSFYFLYNQRIPPIKLRIFPLFFYLLHLYREL